MPSHLVMLNARNGVLHKTAAHRCSKPLAFETICRRGSIDDPAIANYAIRAGLCGEGASLSLAIAYLYPVAAFREGPMPAQLCPMWQMQITMGSAGGLHDICRSCALRPSTSMPKISCLARELISSWQRIPLHAPLQSLRRRVKRIWPCTLPHTPCVCTC
jgi:hypothetical protein